MSFMDKAKRAAEQAAGKARAGVEDVQAKRDLLQSYQELGRATYAVAARGELSHPELDPIVARITELEAGAPTN
jgi:hypothetical protein